MACNGRPVLAVVLARGNSKSVPGKNYRVLNTIPLFRYSVQAAIDSKLVDCVVVSSNCPRVKQLSEDLKLENFYFLDRPDCIAGPRSMNEAALIHAAYWHYFEFGEIPGVVVNLQPTSPVRRKHMIDATVSGMVSAGKKSAMSVYEETPLFVQENQDGTIKWHYNPKTRKMRQDMAQDELFQHDNGAIYCTDGDYLVDQMCRLDENPFLYKADKYEGYQIDTELDFILIEKMMELLKDSGEYVIV
jgi:CMP-N,N'-diacetyllegionaminic acid synthase